MAHLGQIEIGGRGADRHVVLRTVHLQLLIFGPFLGSMLLRMSLTLTGFYFVGGENWERWLLCLIGFVLARLVVKWLTRPPVQHHNSRAPETSYAP